MPVPRTGKSIRHFLPLWSSFSEFLHAVVSHLFAPVPGIELSWDLDQFAQRSSCLSQSSSGKHLLSFKALLSPGNSSLHLASNNHPTALNACRSASVLFHRWGSSVMNEISHAKTKTLWVPSWLPYTQLLGPDTSVVPGIMQTHWIKGNLSFSRELSV